MGIQVLAPSVNASKVDFDIQVGSEEAEVNSISSFDFPIEQGSTIRFGLGAIKNVSTRGCAGSDCGQTAKGRLCISGGFSVMHVLYKR